MKDFLQRSRANRLWLRLISHEHLARLLAEPCADPDLRARFLAETVMRAWLLCVEFAPQSSPMRAAFVPAWRAYGINDTTIDRISQWCAEQSVERSFSLPVALKDTRVVKMLTHELANWQHADFLGVFVVKHGDQDLLSAIALPCTVETSYRPNECVIRTEDDEALRGLARGVDIANHVAHRLIATHTRHLVTVAGVLADEAEELPFEGESLGLALLVYLTVSKAHKPFAVAASGVLKRNGTLDAQRNARAVLQAKAELLKAIGVARIILPAVGKLPAGITAWPVARVLDNQIAQLQSQFATAKPATLDVDVDAELKRLDSGMRYGTIPLATARTALKPLVKCLATRTDPHGLRYWAWATTLLASAECHQGNPQRSSDLCKVVLKTRNQVGTRCTAHALIRQAVNLTDMMEYEGAVRMCDEALEVIGTHSDDLERKDLEMQAYGTRAQALMYWGLQDKSKKEPAWRDVNRAVALARELHHPDNRANDLARDLNYRYLWYACFEPTKGRRAFDEAYHASRHDEISRAHLLRIRWYAAYRAHLLGKKVNWRAFEDELPEASIEGGWLHKLSLKYRGTLRAHAGTWNRAMDDFKTAAVLLDTEKPIFHFLGATVALEASIALQTHDPETAQQYFHKAVDFFGAHSVLQKNIAETVEVHLATERTMAISDEALARLSLRWPY